MNKMFIFNDLIINEVKKSAEKDGEYVLKTTDTNIINNFCSALMEQIKCGIAVERFIGCDESCVVVTDCVKHGVVEEMNTHELCGVEPLESLPVFNQNYS